MPLSVGDRLGPYEILAPIGVGGMGEVYKARDTRLGRTVAIKMVRGEHMERFEHEARAIAALSHPHICTLHDVGADYLVMEYVEGAALRGPIPARETVRLAMQIADALDAAHHKGIIHRDLKPGNILVSANGIKLLDFGLAKLAPASTAEADTVTQTLAGAILGTVAYMSPEQAEGKPVDARSDIFSFGVVLYETLSGRRPFTGDTTVSTLAAILREQPRQLVAPQDLARIVARCLAKSPADRFQSMTELKAALEQASTNAAEQQPSIAVLPFTNMSGDKDNEYFSDGLAEEIINALARIPRLKVIARSSAFAFRGKQEDVRKIAEALGVANVLEGSVRKMGTRIRVTAQLIAADDGSHLWSERFDRELTDIFAIQDEISQAIADALKVKLARAPGADGIRKPANLEAYRACLEGRLHLRQMTAGGMTRALECYQRAIQLDPSSAMPYVALAQRGYHQAVYLDVRPRDVIPEALAAADRALQLDPEAAQAYVVRGIIRTFYEFNWKGAGEDFARALEINPSSAGAISGRAFWYLSPLGQANEALPELRRALDLDPRSLLTRVAEVLVLGLMGNREQEVERGRALVELFPGFWIAWYQYGIAHCFQGAQKTAVSAMEKGLAIAPGNVYLLAMLALVHGRQGNFQEAARIRSEIEQSAARRYVSLLARSLACESTGDMDYAYELVDQALDERDPQALTFLAYRRLELQSDPRYQALLRKMNIAVSLPARPVSAS
jgi:eukaryotic-like serine/threonine-protein kinase